MSEMSELRTRDEHLAWCKERALEYLDIGEPDNAFASMMSDLIKHDGTKNHAGIELGMKMMRGGFLSNEHDMRRWIVGFR